MQGVGVFGEPISVSEQLMLHNPHKRGRIKEEKQRDTFAFIAREFETTITTGSSASI